MHTSKHMFLIAAARMQACGDSGTSADGGTTCAAPDGAVA